MRLDISPRAMFTVVTVCATAVASVYGLRALAEPVPAVPANVSSGQTLTAAYVNSQNATVAAVINQIRDPACPIGYTQDTSVTGVVDCKSGADDVVKVGSGGAAFWIDRYEASVWDGPLGTGNQYGGTSTSGAGGSYPSTFPQDGQRAPSFSSFAPLYAASVAGVQPSASITWFQAVEACEASGKRLPDGQEWLRAASGTPDPGSSTGSGGTCVTAAGGPRATGQGSACASAWGAQDMIGNMWEWTADWYAATSNLDSPIGGTAAGNAVAGWPSGYNDGADGVWGVVGSPWNGAADKQIPSAALRGGYWGYGSEDGVFALDLYDAPSGWFPSLGLRCLLPR